MTSFGDHLDNMYEYEPEEDHVLNANGLLDDYYDRLVASEDYEPINTDKEGS